MTARWGWFLVIPLLLSLVVTGGTQYIFLEKSFMQEMGYGRTGAWIGFDNFVQALRNPVYLSSAVVTVRVAAITTLACILLAYPLAYAIARASGPVAMLMLGGILLTSLVTTPIKVLGLIIIFAKDGALNRFLVWSGATDAPVSLLGTEAGVVVGLIYFSLGFAVLLLYSVIRTISRNLEDAAAIHGAGRARVMWRVVFPLSLPGVVVVTLTVFSLTMGAFAAAALMGGGRVLTLPVLIYRTIFIETKYATASTLSAILLVMVLLLNLASVLLISVLKAKPWRAVTRRRPHMLESAGDLIRAARASLGERFGTVAAPIGRFLVRAWIVWVYVMFFAPLFVIVGASFNGGSFRSGAVVFPPRQISLDWYLATPESHIHAFGVSIALAAAATALACLIALPAGLGLVRSRIPGREAAAAFFRIPLQIPVVIIGLAFFYTYYAIDAGLKTELTGSFAGLVFAHFFILAPFVIGSVTAVLHRFDERLEEAAASLGAGRWRTFRRVTLPVIAPGIFAGAVYAFMVSFGDVPISLFLAGANTTPFPVLIFHAMEMDFDARVLSSSTIVMAFGLILLLLVQKFIGLDSLTRADAGARG